MTRVLIFAFGDRNHGMGHIMRCLVLADQLVRSGVEVEFATAPETPGMAWLAAAGWRCHAVAETSAPVGIGLPPFDAVVIDLEQGPTVELLLAVRAAFPTVINIGCIGFAPTTDPRVVDRLVDLQIYGVALFDPPRSLWELAGPRFLLINPAYRDCKPDSDGPIVVSLGGADPRRLTPVAIEAAASSGRPVRAVIGPAAEPYQGDPPAGVELLVSPPSLLPVIDGASLVITATGMTCYEALCAGVPCILTNWSPDHEQTAVQLQKRRVARNLGLWDEFTAGLVRRAIAGYIWDLNNWTVASLNARDMVDGQGAARVTKAICQLIAAK